MHTLYSIDKLLVHCTRRDDSGRPRRPASGFEASTGSKGRAGVQPDGRPDLLKASNDSSAGNSSNAPTMFQINSSTNSRPMSAWNFNAENDQVATPIARVMPVNATEVPVVFSASKNASRNARPWARKLSRHLG